MNVFINKTREERERLKKQKDEESYKAASKCPWNICQTTRCYVIMELVDASLFGLATLVI